MAEEKKSPNLKDRLKKTAVSSGAGGAIPGPPVMPPPGGGAVPPPGGPVAGPGTPFIPGIPGLSDVAPPAFVQQQQAAAAAAARARAAADDPFGGGTVAPGPQDVRLVIDERPVDAQEVGRNRTGLFIAVGVTAVVGMAAGYLLGGTSESKSQERQTLSAVTSVRGEITRLGDVVNQIKTHVDRAAERGNITAPRGEGEPGPAPAATHAPEVDEELISWFRQQPPDPPLSPDVYAGRVGRLKAQVVSKLALVQLQVNEIWRQLQVHSRMTNVPNVRSALTASNPQTNELNRMFVTFARGQSGPVAQLVTLAGAPAQQGGGIQVPITGAGIPSGTTRTVYQQGAIAADALANYALPVQPNIGLGHQMQESATLPWAQYRQRIGEMKQLIEQLQTNQQQLLQLMQARPD